MVYPIACIAVKMHFTCITNCSVIGVEVSVSDCAKVWTNKVNCLIRFPYRDWSHIWYQIEHMKETYAILLYSENLPTL